MSITADALRDAAGPAALRALRAASRSLIDLAAREQKRNRNDSQLRELADFYFKMFREHSASLSMSADAICLPLFAN